MVELPDNVRAAIRCGGIPVIRNWRKIPLKNRTRAERNMTFIEEFCLVPEGKLVGQKVKLALFQEAFFYALYDNKVFTREAILSIARKNAKTATIAFIVVLHVIGPEAELNTQLASGARSRKQAGQVYNYAAKTIRRSPKLAGRAKCTDSSKRIVGLKYNVEYEALAADAGTQIGGSPKIAIIDEAGQIKGGFDEFVEALITGQGAHEHPLTIIISTQAPSDGDWLSIRIDDAEASQSPEIVCHVYEAPKECELLDETAWAMSNPALGLFRNREDLAKQLADAQRMPSLENRRRNLLLNQRVNADDPLVSKSAWDACKEEIEIPLGAKIYAGLDLSLVSDLSALVWIANIENRIATSASFWVPKENIEKKEQQDRVPYTLWHKRGYLEYCHGPVIDFENIADRLRWLFDNFDVQAVAFDRYKFEALKRKLVEYGFSPEELDKFSSFGQGWKSMSPAIDIVEADVIQKRLAHGNNPVLNWCAGNTTVATDTAGNRKLIKMRQRNRRIDGMVALTMARGVAGEVEPPKPQGTPWDRDENYRLEL